MVFLQGSLQSPFKNINSPSNHAKTIVIVIDNINTKQNNFLKVL